MTASVGWSGEVSGEYRQDDSAGLPLVLLATEDYQASEGSKARAAGALATVIRDELRSRGEPFTAVMTDVPDGQHRADALRGLRGD